MGQLSVGGVAATFRPVLKLLTASGTYTIPYAGWYRIAAVGHGGQGAYRYFGAGSGIFSPGGAGGMGYVDKYLPSGTVLTATITDALSKVAIGSTDLISATAGSSEIASQADGGCRAGTASGDGVVAAPSNGTVTPDITPPDAYNDPMYISPGGQSGFHESGSSSVDDKPRAKSGGNGLFGGNGGAGGDSVWVTSGLGSGRGYCNGLPGDRGGADGEDAGQKPSGSSVTTYSGAGGGGGYGGGGGAVRSSVSNASSGYVKGDDGAAGGAGCVRIERIR